MNITKDVFAVIGVLTVLGIIAMACVVAHDGYMCRRTEPGESGRAPRLPQRTRMPSPEQLRDGRELSAYEQRVLEAMERGERR